MWRRVKDLLRPVKKTLFGPAPRAKNDYATHVPVLIGLSKIGPIKSVLELGSGKYSTLTFLNREVFPDLEVLDSFETDPDWAERVRELVKLDKRATMHVVDGPMVEAVGRIDLDVYDLVFVDDSSTSVDRATTKKKNIISYDGAITIATHT